MQNLEKFRKACEKLNKEQKEAVDFTEGPVMVVAGPGTGKTQILALRIANILEKGVANADEILCLTFTNAGVLAMQERLYGYIGGESRKIKISTFHSFAIELIEKYYDLLSFSKFPELLTDDRAVFLIDEILYEKEWEYLRPRSNPSTYFNDLKQLISILKRERITVEEFLNSVNEDIERLKNDPDSISSRGERKGEIKKEIEKKIEALEKTREVVDFYRIYEEKKKELFLMDYDDVLEYIVRLSEDFEEVKSYIREEYQYVLIDEHQDSSGVQNSFLKAVWQDVEKPNIFVVGDDRQLIYGFSGASVSYFEEFKHIFGKTKLITLIENYRSTLPILNTADELLKSRITDKKLKSNTKGDHKIILSEYTYARDEIIGAGLFLKEKIESGIEPKDCALLVPRNYQVRQAIEILNDIGLSVVSGKNMSFFRVPETKSLRNILGVISDPFNSVLIADSLLDSKSGIATFEAHKFFKNTKSDKITIEELINLKETNNLFVQENKISVWGNKLKIWINNFSNEKISRIVNIVGNELLVDTSKNNDELLKNIEVVRSFIHLASLFEERNKNGSLKEFLDYLNRLDSYNTHIELIKFGSENGIKVMTLHKSKGLEYKCVVIAHMNEEILMSEKRGGFTLPENIKKHIEKRNIENAKKELYVAITRAKEFCVISYARENYNRGEMELAHIISELSDSSFIKKNKEDTEKEILSSNIRAYTNINKIESSKSELEDIKKLVRENYTDRKISVTLLNNFFECPWKWYFRNFLQVPEIKGVSLALGSTVHYIIEFLLNSDKFPDDKQIKEKIKDKLQFEGIDKEKELRRLTEDAFFAVNNWILGFYKDIALRFKTERAVSYKDKKFPHLNIYGKIDLVEYLPEGDIRVTDFKTGSSKTKNVIEKYENGRMSSYLRQLAMYSYLISGDNKENKVSESRLLFLEEKLKDKNSLYSTKINKEQIDLLIKDIEDYDNLIKSGEWVSLPCNYNSYGKNTECEYCKKALIYQ